MRVDGMTPEGKVKQKITAWLKAHDVWYFMPRGTTFGRSGIPDYIACLYGRLIGIEAKAGSNKPTALQLLEHKKMRLAGAVVFVINEHNIGELDAMLKEAENGNT
jgi:hypothetical protein